MIYIRMKSRRVKKISNRGKTERYIKQNQLQMNAEKQINFPSPMSIQQR